MASYEPAKGRRYEAGVARKTRSPSLYERYPVVHQHQWRPA